MSDNEEDVEAGRLERAMTQQPEPPGNIRDMDRALVGQMRDVFCASVDELCERLPNVVYLEVQTALISAFAAQAFDALSKCPPDLFEINRYETLRLLGITAAMINELRLTEAQVALMPVSPIVH